MTESVNTTGPGPSSTSTSSDEKPKVIQRGKGKALNALAAASGRDPAAIIAAAEAAAAAAEEAEAAEAAAKLAKEQDESEKEKASSDENNDYDNAEEEDEQNQAKIYESLSPEEQYRFECFRRCGFQSKAVGSFIAKVMVDEANRRCAGRRVMTNSVGGILDGSVPRRRGGSASRLVPKKKNANVSSSSSKADENSSPHHGSKRTSQKAIKRKKKHLLKEESKRRRAAMDQPLPYYNRGNGSISEKGESDHASVGNIPPLDHLVVNNSATEIVAVVATLAKCYGQRLVAAARRVADSEEVESSLEHANSELLAADLEGKKEAETLNSTGKMKPLQPHHFLKAHEYRSRAGLDPGFWMGGLPSSGIGFGGARSNLRGNQGYSVNSDGGGSKGVVAAAALGTVNWDRIGYLAALAAQDNYDELDEVDEGNGMDVDEAKDCVDVNNDRSL